MDKTHVQRGILIDSMANMLDQVDVEEENSKNHAVMPKPVLSFSTTIAISIDCA